MTVEFWRFGGTPVPAGDVGTVAKRLEDLGWDGLVVGEDAGVLSEPYVFLAAAAAATTKLKLGTGVSVPLRDPLQAANAVVTLQTVSHGRFLPSFGRGDGGLAILGRRPITVSGFIRYVERVKAYLAHEQVEVDGFVSSMERLYSADPSVDAARPRIDVSATGPRMIAFGATVADGVTFAVGADVERIRQCVAQAREAREAGGLDPDSVRLSAYVPAAVAVDGDRAAARDTIRGGVLRHARFSAFEGTPLDGVSKDDQATVLRAFEATRDHGISAPKPADFSVATVIDDDFLDRFAVVGPPKECAERFQEIIDLGIQRLVVLTRVPTTDPGEQNAARIAQEVLPLLR
jgi:5,10-methylenetetrahydromethanopterin reductase